MKMVNFREVNDNDILKDWLLFREEEISSLNCEEDKKHWIYFDEISDKILKSIPKNNREYVKKQLDLLDDNFFESMVAIALVKDSFFIPFPYPVTTT